MADIQLEDEQYKSDRIQTGRKTSGMIGFAMRLFGVKEGIASVILVVFTVLFFVAAVWVFIQFQPEPPDESYVDIPAEI